MTDPVAAANRAADILSASGDPMGLLVAEGLRQAAAGAARADVALGLTRRALPRPDPLAERNHLLREIYRVDYYNMREAPAAREILHLVRRRERARSPARNEAERMMDLIVRDWPNDIPHSERQIVRILDIKNASAMSKI